MALAAVGASTAAAIPAAAQPPTPVGVGPLPITFHITDQNGKWFDSGLNLFGDQSLAVGVLPRLGISGGGMMSAADTQRMLNTDTGNTLTNLVKGVTDKVPTLGSLGTSLWKALNLDSTLSAVQQLGTNNPKAAAPAMKATSLLNDLVNQLSSLPVDQPINLGALSSFVQLQDTLNSLKVLAPVSAPVTVNFTVDPAESQGPRDPFGLIAPVGAQGFPWMQSENYYGTRTIQLTQPGLYAFADGMVPYELGAVVVHDPLTIGLEFGKSLQVNSRNLVVPSNSDIVNRLVNTFFNITNPNNWQHFEKDKESSFDPTDPPVPILENDAAGNAVLVPNLDAYFDKKFGFPKTLVKGDQLPATPGVGEVWLDTQMEEWNGKDKTGSATKINATDWSIDRKIGAPYIDMNNPHNMWTDKDYKYLYQSEWFHDVVDVFDRNTGAFVRQLKVGTEPAHVMTETGSDNLVIGLNGGNEMVEAAPGATSVIRKIPVSPTGTTLHPHAHWTSGDGKTVVAPDTESGQVSVVDMPSGTVNLEPVGQFPIAMSMTPDGGRFYSADFLGESLTCVSLGAPQCHKDGKLVHSSTIDLWANYSPQDGPKSGAPFGGLTIQLPVSPDGHAMIAENVLSQTLTIVDPRTDKIVKDIPCAAGCHGANFGAKKGGGYYAYVSSKFANVMQIIDLDPNNDGDISDAKEVGRLVLDPTATTKMDGSVSGEAGYGGQGVLPIPLVYNGWVQQNQGAWRQMLTCQQLNPITPSACGK
ncbi:YncE family protein [Amycolatopsis acididurans]|uniref:YncE family protein n=1 Tax=Amycolatopsis acididurans TaxID=2724524 RepID=UPI0028A7D87F|nr:copper oxidase [Amycolatopsis acididurans]